MCDVKIPPYPSRLHYAIQAYKELLFYIQQMSLSQDPMLRDSAKVIHSNIFYYPEYRDAFITLLRNFYEVFQTRACLRDIIEATHIYLQQMERYMYCSGDHSISIALPPDCILFGGGRGESGNEGDNEGSKITTKYIHR
jgi:hypothetical protein